MEVKLRPLREKEDDAVYQMFQEIPAEEEERVDSQRKDRFEYQFFRIPCIWRQIFRRWKRCRMRSREHTGFAGEAETIWDKVY